MPLAHAYVNAVSGEIGIPVRPHGSRCPDQSASARRRPVVAPCQLRLHPRGHFANGHAGFMGGVLFGITRGKPDHKGGCARIGDWIWMSVAALVYWRGPQWDMRHCQSQGQQTGPDMKLFKTMRILSLPLHTPAPAAQRQGWRVLQMGIRDKRSTRVRA